MSVQEKPARASRAGSIFQYYYRAVRRYPWLLTPLLFGTIGLQVTELIYPLYLRRFFNLLAIGKPDPSTVHEMLGILGIIAIVSFSGWVARRIQNVSISYLESHVMRDLASTAFNYLIGHSYDFFVSRFAGSLTHKVNRFSRAFEIMFDALMLQFFPTLLYVIGAVTILFLRNHVLGIALGIWVICFVTFQIFFARFMQPLRVARAQADHKVTGVLADSISNHMTIVLFSGTKHESGRLGEVVGQWCRATMRSWNVDELMWAALGFFMISINVGLLYGALVFWQRGLLTVGDFVLIQAYLINTFGHLVEINRDLRKFHDAFADAREMVDMLEVPHEIQDQSGAPQLVVHNGTIAFKDMGFYFHAGRPILEHFNLFIKASEKVALVGPSGAGKSTVIKLLLRLYNVPAGSIEIDGHNILEVSQESVRDAISFVPQEPILFHRSLMENIRYGNRTATDKEVIRAAKQAHCHEFISNLPEGYETYVGERGVKLSGGERQRVAIARAILKNAPILVLDEATSSLDSESESLIQDALETLMKGKTVIVIAHRLSTIMKMDRIVVLENGNVVAEGTHNELLEHGGLYQKLWSIQAGSFLNDDQ